MTLAVAAEAQPPEVSARRGWSHAWFWITGPAFSALLVVTSIMGMSQRYLTETHRPPDVLALDLVLIGAACLSTRWRWPLTSLLVAIAVPTLLTWRGYYDGTVAVAAIGCLLAVAYRRRLVPIVVGTVAMGAGWLASASLDATDHGGPGVVLAVGGLFYVVVGIAARYAHDWIASRLRRRRARKAAVPVVDHPPDLAPPPWSLTLPPAVPTSVLPAPVAPAAPSPRRLVHDHRAAVAVAAVVVIALSQVVFLAYTRTFWPVDPGSTRFASAFCGDLTRWNGQIVHDASILDRAQATATVADKRDLQAAMIGQLADQTGAVATELRRAADDQPAGSAARLTGTQLATQLASIADQLHPLQTRWEVLPVDNRSDFDRARAPLLDEFNRITATLNPALLVGGLADSTTASQRALARALHTAPACASLEQ